MKKIYIILSTAVLMTAMAACNPDGELARTPVATVEVSATSLEINQSMEIRFTGVADQVVIFTGDDGHAYALRDSENNTGFVVNKGLFTYSYSTPGTFRVTCVASTYDTFLGESLQHAATEFEVTVVDDVTTIDKIYSSITPNVYFASQVNDNDWVMCLPTKQVYSGKELAVNAKKARLSFDIASDSTKLFLDDVAYSTKAYYNLTQPIAIRLISNAGTVRDYTLHTVIYPEFNTLEADGVAATLTRSAYDQDLLTYTVVLPADADPATVKPTWTVDADVTVTAVSATEYLLTRTSAAGKDVKAVSRAVVEYVKE